MEGLDGKDGKPGLRVRKDKNTIIIIIIMILLQIIYIYKEMCISVSQFLLFLTVFYFHN